MIKKLSRWFSASARILPWREDPSPYRVWISEIMLQQTQVITVVPYFEKFITRFPTVESLASADLSEVLANWSGLGYYSRARNIHRAAGLVVAGGFPRDRAGWEELPGVGPYTAGAILSIAYHMPEAIVDGNVERVLSRMHRLKSRDKNKIWSLSRGLLGEAARLKVDPSVLNQGLMELGARVCKPKNPLCDVCPARSDCQAFAKGDVEKFPVKKPRVKSVDVQERTTAFVTKDFKVLVTLDESARWRKGLWDLPLEVKSSQNVYASKKDPKLQVKYVVTKHKVSRVISLKYFTHNAKNSSNQMMKANSDSRWIRLDEAITLPHGASLRKSLKVLSDAIQPQRCRS
ncbi:MAG: A/G-specific adenine glycosylase [Xanthomonadaceae bacterium]|nr:A/G-specific adenine glycosylase [Xanthomonadaceae bacterium]